VDKSEYTNLIMDDMPINNISLSDKEFLEGFLECQFLSLNSTNLKVIANLPAMPKLERLELCDNGIETGFEVIAR
jgi:dynein assembly factor 1